MKKTKRKKANVIGALENKSYPIITGQDLKAEEGFISSLILGGEF